MGDIFSENNKRIAKNTFFLYIRMLLIMIVGLFTTRIILSTLGVEDYGIYVIVGGTVALFSFLNATLSTATARFITFELGTGDLGKLKKTFSGALTVHIFLALIFCILAETVGLWILENKLMISEGRMEATHIVYQLSIITAIIGIIQVPYNASIIAHERMNVYAYFSIIEVLLKLGVAYSLMVSNFDKLITYALLNFIIVILIASLYKYYATKKFIECKFGLCYEKKIIVPMLSFSGWDLYGNMSIIARTQGVNIMQNIFFGTLINAAGGIATQVQNATAQFAENFLTAIRPQIVKNYAKGNIIEVQNLVINTSKFSFLLLFFISFPLILENKFILNLWLENVPDYAVAFCKLVLINNLVSIIFRPGTYLIHATGRIKRMSFFNGTVLFMILPFSYFFLKIGFPPTISYVINIILLIICCIYGFFILKSYIPEYSICMFVKKSLIIILFILFVSTPIPIILYLVLFEGWIRFLSIGFSFILCLAFSIFFIGIDRQMRRKIICLVKDKISKQK